MTQENPFYKLMKGDENAFGDVSESIFWEVPVPFEEFVISPFHLNLNFEQGAALI